MKLCKTSDELVEYMWKIYPSDQDFELREAMMKSLNFLNGNYDQAEKERIKISEQIYDAILKKFPFITEDGVEIKNGEVYWYVVTNNSPVMDQISWKSLNTTYYSKPLTEFQKPPLGSVHFSTKEKADEYILSNRKIDTYEIINLFDGFNRFYKKLNGKFTINLESEYSLDNLLTRSDIKIITIKRLSDNEIFEVGEKIKIDDVITKISEFKIDDNDGSINVYTEYENVYDINYINKNPILLITEDGVDIYENDVVYIVSKEYTHVYDFVCKANIINIILERENSLKFSEKKLAEEYLILNKPMQISIQEIENMIETIKFNSFDQRTDFIDKLKCFVKSKI